MFGPRNDKIFFFFFRLGKTKEEAEAEWDFYFTASRQDEKTDTEEERKEGRLSLSLFVGPHLALARRRWESGGEKVHKHAQLPPEERAGGRWGGALLDDTGPSRNNKKRKLVWDQQSLRVLVRGRRGRTFLGLRDFGTSLDIFIPSPPAPPQVDL